MSCNNGLHGALFYNSKKEWLCCLCNEKIDYQDVCKEREFNRLSATCIIERNKKNQKCRYNLKTNYIQKYAKNLKEGQTMDHKKYMALGKYVIVKIIKEEQDKKPGIIVVSDLPEKVSFGIVTDIGVDITNKNSYLNDGDKVAFHKEAGLTIDANVVAVEFEDIVAVVKESSEE
jgi:co-chaperonin GroES (HSP10)